MPRKLCSFTRTFASSPATSSSDTFDARSTFCTEVIRALRSSSHSRVFFHNSF